MWLVILLLSVIAVGILLMSDPGKVLLQWILIALVVGGVGYLLFILFFLAASLSFEDDVLPVFGGIGVLILIFVLIDKISKAFFAAERQKSINVEKGEEKVPPKNEKKIINNKEYWG